MRIFWLTVWHTHACLSCAAEFEVSPEEIQAAKEDEEEFQASEKVRLEKMEADAREMSLSDEDRAARAQAIQDKKDAEEKAAREAAEEAARIKARALQTPAKRASPLYAASTACSRIRISLSAAPVGMLLTLGCPARRRPRRTQRERPKSLWRCASASRPSARIRWAPQWSLWRAIVGRGWGLATDISA